MTNSAQIIRDQNSNPAIAVLPINEYERLLKVADEVASIRAFDAYKATQPETFPDEVANRLLNSEHPVKVFREHLGMTQTQLAEVAGLRQACVSQIEAGSRVGTINVLKRRAEALRVDLDDLT
jgi:DNA-binding XRE family transcriptional regulator